MKKVLILLLLASLGVSKVSKAQVNLQLRSDAETGRVEISMVPEKTYDFPKEITGSIQVTLKVPKSSAFKPGKIFSEIPNVNWMENNTLEAIGEYNYYTYGVEPLGGAVRLEENKEVKLFTFIVDGEEKPEILLLDSEDGIIDYSYNELSLDIANNISIATTMGVSNAYNENLYPDLKVSEAGEGSSKIDIVFPNPGIRSIYVEYSYFSNVEGPDPLKLNFIENGTGRILLEEVLGKKIGRQSKRVDVSDLSEGKYLIVLQEGDQVLSEGYHFIKGL